ncbi:MAG: SDR family NAD(P)-dependent oxidoreductase [Flavobacteriia bacterium]|nr:SDR family NAD(P)-dependent oxidoreductase [Flavobacteriia bacterium]
MIYIITGISRGIGKALVEHYLKTNQKIIGIGRFNPFNDNKISFIQCDFSSLEELKKIKLPLLKEEVTLINNAGIIGEISPLIKKETFDDPFVFQVNVFTPVFLMKKVRLSVENSNQLTVLNISSGAGRRPIASWSSYCASKAALDSYSEVFQEEEKELGHKTKVYALAPGVIDTDMQKKIRETKEELFSSWNFFNELKSNNKLKSVKQCAKEIAEFLESEKDENVLCRL